METSGYTERKTVASMKSVEAYLDDVWEYNTSSQEWAWMAGSNSVPSGSSNGCIICAAPPVFGNYQTPSAGNTPAEASNRR